MPVPTPANQQAAIIDRERTRLENSALFSARPALLNAQLEMTNAVLGRGPFAPMEVAARMTANLTPALGQNLLYTALTARLRALTTAAAVVEPAVSGGGRGGRGGGGRLLRGASGPGGGRVPTSINELAQRFARRRLNLNTFEVEVLTDGYRRTAANVAGNLGNQALKAAEKAAVDLVRSPLSTADAATVIRNRLSAAGLTTRNPYAVETIYRTTVQTAYSAGRWQANQDPAVQEILWGYEYSAVMDDRTTDLCAELDGMRRPIDDPIWAQYTPPNHFNCRSTLIEVFKTDSLAKPTDVPSVVIPDGFKVNWGTLLRAA